LIDLPKKKDEPKHDEEKTYEVKDKRRVNPDGTLKEDVEPEPAPAEAAEPKAAEPQPEPQAAEAGEAAKAPEPETELPPPNVFETLQFITGLLAEQAWQLMGLHLAPGRKEPTVDMAQAKVAIDVVISIADKLHPHLDDESRRSIRGLISDLQINFVQHNK